jgi:hypothetical protein
MKYLCLVYLDQEQWSACPDHLCASYAEQLSESKRLIAAEPLHPVHTATTVRIRNGQVQLYDGPFAETKEQLAGFYLVDAKGSQRGDSDRELHPAGETWKHRSKAGPPIGCRRRQRPVTRLPLAARSDFVPTRTH